MAAVPPPLQNDLRPPARERKITIVYERDVQREIRALNKKIDNLERKLNSELEKISSCSGLLEEIIVQPQGSPCSPLRDELDRARAKRERAFQKFQRQQLGMEMGHGHGGAAPNPSDGATGSN